MKFCMWFSGIREGSGLLEVRKDKDWEDPFLQWRGHQLTCKTVAWCKGEARLQWLWEKTRGGWSSVSQCVDLSPTVWNFVPKLSSVVSSIPHSTSFPHFAPLNLSVNLWCHLCMHINSGISFILTQPVPKATSIQSLSLFWFLQPSC